MASKEAGLMAKLTPVDKLVAVNNLQEVTNPIYLNRNVPTPDGVLSYEIFGSSQEDRRTRMAYIDLHGHYMYPLAALKLKAYDRTLDKVLFSQGRYRLTKEGALVEDDENGDSGPEFLYSIWGKVKVKDKTTASTKEIQKFYEQPRDKLFLTKYPVIPAFYRDINTSTNSMSKSSNVLNSWYSSIIAYTQTLNQYTETFSHMSRITQSRIQGILVQIYQELMVNTVKGNPSKFGMLRRSLQGKNINYSARCVISAPVMIKQSPEDVQVKFGYALIPMAYVLSCFFPFIIYYAKQFFDAEFIQGGKAPVMDPKTKEIRYITYTESFDENYITKLVTRYINSPSSRFDLMETPTDEDGNVYHMVLTGRFNKDNTTFTREMTLTDFLYIVAKRATKDKHVFITRYPLDNYNGQFPCRVEISTTNNTMPVTIGNEVYKFFPVCEGDPSNSFVETAMFSNTYLGPMGGDYDGDTISIKPVFFKEDNDECEKRIMSNGYILSVEGRLLREMTKDFVLCGYNVTRISNNDDSFLVDINTKKAKYDIA